MRRRRRIFRNSGKLKEEVSAAGIFKTDDVSYCEGHFFPAG